MTTSRFKIPGSTLILFALGALIGPFGDICHIISGTDGYPTEGFQPRLIFGLPIWVPLLFGSAAVGIGLSHAGLSSAFQLRSKVQLSWNLCFVGFAAFMGLYAVSGFLPLPTGGARDFVLAAIALVIWYGLDRTVSGILLAFGTVLIGCVIEMTLSHLGYFFYIPPAANFNGIPSWLPWIYVAASVTIGNFGRMLLLQPKV